MGQVATHLNLVTRVFMNTQFASYSDPGVFIIVPMVIINLEVEPLYVDNFIGVEAYLIQFSETNHNGFCLAYKFTHRDFNDGVLGLAYVANTRFGAGGICDSFTGSRGLNTGTLEPWISCIQFVIITLFNIHGRNCNHTQFRTHSAHTNHFSHMGSRDGTQFRFPT